MDADDGWGLGPVTGLQQAMCGEPAAKQEPGASEQCAVPHARAFCRVCAVLCAVAERAWVAAAVVRCAGGLLPRSLAGAAAERQSGGFKHSLSLFLHPHPLHEGLFNFG